MAPETKKRQIRITSKQTFFPSFRKDTKRRTIRLHYNLFIHKLRSLTTETTFYLTIEVIDTNKNYS